ncbi:VC0807 family protein [Pseudonocardia sp. CA-107938]|uniref:VC0807 family protein n=1 Tax=Pseudonocardia sp. CA-107938 TaxID=3240021 RepID=UPI003D8E9E00
MNRSEPNEADTRAGGMRAMVRGLLIDVGLPIITYYVLRAAGASEWVALLAATGVAAARIVWGVVAQREVNQFATVMLLVYGLGLVLALVTGDERVLLLKSSLITASIGAVFLVTAVIGRRPLTLAASQSFQPARAAEIAEEFRTEPAARRAHRLISAVWGTGLLAEAILRIPVVYLLPIDIGYLISELMLVGAFVLLIGWTVWYVRRLGSNASAPAAESA